MVVGVTHVYQASKEYLSAIAPLSWDFFPSSWEHQQLPLMQK